MKKHLLRGVVLALVAVTASWSAPPALSVSTKYRHESYSFWQVTQVDQMVLTMTATDPDGTTPVIFANNLPAGATFVDSGNGNATMFWTPGSNQLGFYSPRFVASDGMSADVDTILILVAGYPLSHGFYRIGYANGTSVRCVQDHLTHSPILKLDLIGDPQFQLPDSIPNEYQIVASASGRVEEIIDTNCACCSGCSQCNNHVRIRHSNGEWTKYTHFETGSVAVDTTVGNDCVTIGTYLGEEGDVGATTGSLGSFNRNQLTCGQPNDCLLSNANPNAKCFVHLHTEVRASGPASGLRIPLFCDVPGNVLRQGDVETAGNCNSASCPTDLSLPTTTVGGNQITVIKVDNEINMDGAAFFTVEETASVAMVAGGHITLKPGFSAKKYSYFHAWIAPCNSTAAGCPTD